MHALLQQAEVGAPVAVEGDDLAVEHGLVGAERSIDAPELGIAVADGFEVAAFQTHVAGRAVGDRAHAVPLDLEPPCSSSPGSSPVRASIGTMRSGIGSRPGSAGGSMRWIIQSFGGSSLSIANSA